MKMQILLSMAMALGLLGTGCGESTGGQSQSQTLKPNYTVVTTCGMVRDIVKNVVGDKGNVIGLMGNDVDPHLHKPTRDDKLAIQNADIIFYSGLMLEGRMADTFTLAASKGKPAYAVTTQIDEKYLLEPEAFEGHWDPHVWMDVDAWSQAVQAVADALAKHDPPNAATYQDNAKSYRAELEKLHAYAQKTIGSIPKDQRVLITAHDAFNYFGRAYQIEVMGVQGISTESQAGLDDINQLVDLIVKRKVPAVFFESTVDKKNVQKLMEGAQDKGHSVKIGGELFSDAMGKEGTYEGTYIGMIDHKVTIIARALGGQAPARGMNGKLSLEPHTP